MSKTPSHYDYHTFMEELRELEKEDDNFIIPYNSVTQYLMGWTPRDVYLNEMRKLAN